MDRACRVLYVKVEEAVEEVSIHLVERIGNRWPMRLSQYLIYFLPLQASIAFAAAARRIF